MAKKARLVTIGERGQEPLTVVPRAKPVFEFNGWVLREKVKLGFLTVLAILVGAIAALFSWQGLLIVCGIGFIVGFYLGGDREASP